MAAEQIPEYARVFMEALKEAEVSVVTALPESLLATVYRRMKDKGHDAY